MWLLTLALLADTTRSFAVTIAPAESLHVETTGAGGSQPVVLVPGLFGSAFGYRQLTPHLVATGYRVIVIEPLGVGSSGRPARADYSLTAQADRLAAVFDSLGLRHALVVAHSVGGSEALRLAYRRPDLVRGLVSLEGGPAETAVTPEFRRAMRFAPWIRLLGGMKLIRWQIRRMLVASSGDASWVTDDAVQGYTAGAAQNLTGTLKAFLAMSAARERVKLRPHLSEIRCPVRLVVGGAPHDGDVGADEILLLRKALPSFALDSVPGAGHFLQEERPDAVAAALAQVRAADPP